MAAEEEVLVEHHRTFAGPIDSEMVDWPTRAPPGVAAEVARSWAGAAVGSSRSCP